MNKIIALIFSLASCFVMIACIFVDPQGEIHSSIPESVKYMIFAALAIVLADKEFGLTETIKLLIEKWFKKGR